MATDEGPISAHEFARSASAVPAVASAADRAPELSALEFNVMRRGLTEPAGFSEREGLEKCLVADYRTKYPQAGAYRCKGCSAPLYWARSKVGCGTGWPSFYAAVEGAVDERTDASSRGTEVVCADCDAHLGHVFRGEGFGTPTDARYCVNGVCLRYDARAPGQPGDVARVFHLTLGGIPP